MSLGSCGNVNTIDLKYELMKSEKSRDDGVLKRNIECVKDVMCESPNLYNEKLLNKLGVDPTCKIKSKQNNTEDEIPESVYKTFSSSNVAPSLTGNPTTGNPTTVTTNQSPSLTTSKLADKLVLKTTSSNDESIEKYIQMFKEYNLNDRRKVIELLLNKIKYHHEKNEKNEKIKAQKIKELVKSLITSDIFNIGVVSETDTVNALTTLRNATFKLVGGRSTKRKQTKLRRQKRKTRRFKKHAK
jgi:hypothetical protein